MECVVAVERRGRGHEYLCCWDSLPGPLQTVHSHLPITLKGSNVATAYAGCLSDGRRTDADSDRSR